MNDYSITMASKLMVVIGAFEDEDNIKRVVNNVESGIEGWLSTLNAEERYGMIQELNSIPGKESSYKGNNDDSRGVSRFRGRLLDTTLLINPACETLHYELLDLFLGGSSVCFIAFGGFITEDSAGWFLHDGLFAFNNFKQILQGDCNM